MSFKSGLLPLFERLRRFLGRRPESAPARRPPTRQPSSHEAAAVPQASIARVPAVSRPAMISLHLGIDFGTRYTKVCFRDRGRDVSEIVTFAPEGRARLDSALCRSHIAME